jgi:hypothetical protein
MVRPIAIRISMYEEGVIEMLVSFLFNGEEERSESMDNSDR